jgi:hypothetical protein
LLNFEASLQTRRPEPSPFPATTNPTSQNTTLWRPHSGSSSHSSWCPSNNNTNRYSTPSNGGPSSSPSNRPFRPYLRYFQICGLQGQTAKRCPSFQLVPINSPNNSSTSSTHPTSP